MKGDTIARRCLDHNATTVVLHLLCFVQMIKITSSHAPSEGNLLHRFLFVRSCFELLHAVPVISDKFVKKVLVNRNDEFPQCLCGGTNFGIASKSVIPILKISTLCVHFNLHTTYATLN